MRIPDVSVVMSVYNGAASLRATLDSILTQEACDFEFIVVNDGSADDSGQILDERATRDGRLKVIHQSNRGLTKALITGCSAARGEYIARQDAGDMSLPGRLAFQSAYLREHPDTVLAASTTQFIGPGGETLFETSRVGTELEEGLAVLDVQSIQGPPHHGSTMFRKDAYVKAGGYRDVFVVAQDIDLWLRLAELGRCIGIDQRFYRAQVEAGSISGRRRKEQFRLAQLAIECATLRRSGLSDQSLLASAIPEPVRAAHRASSWEQARFFYFVASCLRKSDPSSAKLYYRQALRAQPLFLRALIRSALG